MLANGRSWLVAVILLGGAARAEPVEIQRVWPATWDVRDLARKGDALFAATSGGLVEWRQGRSRRWSGLAGARLRSVSPTRRGIWVGGVERAALVDAGRVLRRLDVPRVKRVVEWRGALWFATEERGTFTLRGSSPPRPVSLGPDTALDRQTDLAVFEGDLWVATAGGIVRLGRDGRVRSRLTERDGLASDLVWRLVPTGDRLLAATSGGLSVIRHGVVDLSAPEAVQSARLAVRDIRAVAAGRGTLLVGSYGGGAFRLGPGAEPRRLACPGCDRIQALALGGGDERSESERAEADSLGRSERGVRGGRRPTRWNGVIVAHDGGLVQVSLDGEAPRTLEAAGLPADLTCLASAFGDLWIGSFDRGLYRMARAGRPERVLDARTPIDPRILDLEPSLAGDALWIATARGVLLHDGRRLGAAPGPGAPDGDWAMDLHVDRRTGALWVASSRSLSRLDGSRWTRWTSAGADRLEGLFAVTTDERGHAWIGGRPGLFELDPATGRFTRRSVATGHLPMDFVTALTTWRRGVVAGTLVGGLVRIDRDGRAEPLSDLAGPAAHANPHALGVVGDRLWIGTPDRGLVVAREGGAIAAIDAASGLPASDVTALLPTGRDVAWVATRGGLARVRIDGLDESPTKP